MSIPLGPMPALPGYRAPGGIASDITTEIGGFIQSMLALRQEQEARAFRQAQMELARQQEGRLERTAQAGAAAERDRIGVERQRVADARAEREAERAREDAQRAERQASAAAFGRIVNAIAAGAQPSAEDEAMLIPEHKTDLAGIRELRDRQGDAEGVRRGDETREAQLAQAANEAMLALAAGRSPADVLSRFGEVRGQFFPALNEADLRAAIARAQNGLREEQARMQAGLAALGPEFAEGLGVAPRGGLVDFGGSGNGGAPGSAPPPSLEAALASALPPVLAGTRTIEQQVASARAAFGEQFARELETALRSAATRQPASRPARPSVPTVRRDASGEPMRGPVGTRKN